MKPSTFLSLISSLSLSLTTAAAPNNIEKRTQPGGFYACKNAFWGAPCEYDVAPMGGCMDIGWADWKNAISSFGPDMADNVSPWSCSLFSKTGCGSDSINLRYPGSEDLDYENFNDKTNSLRCEWDSPKLN
ncbi:uncharacterized protein BDZ99DRAFT_459071 [Mytilinidion resinicola]|uniref:Uncharacterized protein n=1 Tax=Mytilinidion resinicola TaxID=574789 RepID=A0A6A6Z1T7_9PEZI|nr:uncharacterized protein BDZ99DRAFT_459071 [Mytilinidion resinicola]KAF2815132.1 hypothetical protein BDZ99DRAFT_459071 [Mytilinidion resinicola]